MSIIICTKNRVRNLQNCINSILKNSVDFPYEIIIIDDHSTDKTPAYLKRISNLSPIRTYINPKSGPAAARNIGIKKSRGNIIIFVDDDAQVSSNWLIEYKSFFEKNPDYMGCYGKTIYEYYFFRQNSIKRIKREEIFKFSTLNIAYRRQVLDKIGLFDEKFKIAAYEDIDLGKRFEKAGLLISYNKNCEIIHKKNLNFRNLIINSFNNGKFLRIFIQKWLQLDMKIAFNILTDHFYASIIYFLNLFLFIFKKDYSYLLLFHDVIRTISQYLGFLFNR
ncbi:MAG: glycosyltransferase [Candidatus Helarchaeota archaeon]